MIEREIVSFDSNVHWDDIAGKRVCSSKIVEFR